MLAPAPALDQPDQLQRARGTARVGFKLRDGATRLGELYQSGAAKIRLPRGPGDPVAVLLNTAGGLAGGDVLSVSARWDEATRATVTSQAAERVYRSLGPAACVSNALEVADGAEACWLPQETIVFDGAALDRRFEADLAGSARLLAVETVVLGRAAMGERVRRVTLRDRWRVRRDGRLVFADDTRIVGDATAIFSGPATGAGASAYATIVDITPDAEKRIGAARELLTAHGVAAGVSAWNGVLVIRMVARDARVLRDDVMRILQDWRGEAMPRVWHC